MSRMDERMAMLEGEMDNLRMRIAVLEAENKELRSKVRQTETYQPCPPIKDPITPWFAKERTCSKCGIVWKGTMGYVCPDGLCPMGKNSILC